jgi:hypothetical protein
MMVELEVEFQIHAHPVEAIDDGYREPTPHATL